MNLFDRLDVLDKEVTNAKWFLPKLQAFWRYFRHRNYVVYEASEWELRNRSLKDD